jgi:DNA (cytosine-5)-methyltransferase 1
MENEKAFEFKTQRGDLEVLNLYACLGGNRLLWENCNVTAVELDPELARMYQERFPNDTVIVGDAHEYLLKHYKKFDFIWTSPPCPSHSKARFWGSKGGQVDAVYPDMTLYQEIILLENYFDGKYCVENVVPYYEPLIPGIKRGRHLYWCNFKLPNVISKRFDVAGTRGKNELAQLCEFHKIDLSSYQGEQSKVKIARNLVDYEAGLSVFNCAVGVLNSNASPQKELWNANYEPLL